MFDKLIHVLVTNPVVLGAFITTALTWVHTWLSSVDKSGFLKQYEGKLHIAFLVTSFLASLMNAASQNELSKVDLTSTSTFLIYWISLLVGGKAMSVKVNKN